MILNRAKQTEEKSQSFWRITGNLIGGICNGGLLTSAGRYSALGREGSVGPMHGLSSGNMLMVAYREEPASSLKA